MLTMKFGEELILRTKLQPPRLRRWTLTRPRLTARLDEAIDYRLSVLVAPTGYGKSTLLAGWLANTAQKPYAWYNLGQLDADPFIFLLHLIYAFRDRFAGLGERALEVLEREWREAGNTAERRAAARPGLHLFINELCANLTTDTFLVLDDFHLLEGPGKGGPTATLAVAEEFIAAAPPNLHIIIASRQRPGLELLPRWQVQQEVLTFDKEALAFTPAETARLFDERYGYRLSEEQAARLSTETEGWIIALQMIWQNLQSSTDSASLQDEFNSQTVAASSEKPETRNSKLEISLDNMLKDLPHNLAGLFDYLAQEVLSHQNQSVQRFLLDTAILRRMSGPLCDYLLERPAGESEAILRHLSESGLFIIVQGDDTNRSYRYHHLFGEFLYSRLQASPERAAGLHRRIALYYEQQGQLEDALHHHLAAEDWAKAAELLESGAGQRLISTGRLERLEHWLTTFPEKFVAAEPGLLFLKGDYLRLTSRFEEALHNYRQSANGYETADNQAGLAKALRGRALVYLDTVQPTAAEEWLERALEAAETTGDRQLLATLHRDLAENKLNRGRPLEAEELYRQARELLGESETTSPNPGDVRILLRSGRIQEASEILEQSTEALGLNIRPGSGDKPGSQVTTPNSHIVRRAGRSHREGLLVLSLLDAIRGDGERAVMRAEQGIFLARELRTPFTEAVAWERLGHALNVQGEFDRALEAYNHGLLLGDKLQVRRLRAEGLMGLCLLYGHGQTEKNNYLSLTKSTTAYSSDTQPLLAARRAAEEGLLIARKAGDEWIEGFLQISLAAALTEQGEPGEAISVAQTARAVLENCGDRFGLTLARLWIALASGDLSELRAVRHECEQGGYQFLLERPTLFGPKSPAMFQKLAEAKNQKLGILISDKPSPQFSVLAASAHPTGCSPPSSVLQITTLGGFAVRRPNGTELGSRDWQRDKARQLFQLLLTRRDKALPKEQILDYLWPESDADTADSRFKVTLNALVRALEPERSSRAQSSYIVRTGSGAGLAYALNMEQGLLELDAVEFEQLANQGAHAELNAASESRAEAAALDYYRRALALYKGDFLPGCLYEDWAAPERERLLTLFLTTAERYSRLLAAQSDWESCLAVCRLILVRDNCWEEAHRLMMLALWKQGHRAAALRAYEKCVATLSEELGIEPVPQTIKLYHEILMD